MSVVSFPVYSLRDPRTNLRIRLDAAKYRRVVRFDLVRGVARLEREGGEGFRNRPAIVNNFPVSKTKEFATYE